MRKIPGVEVTVERGGMGELAVWVDGREVVRSRKFWYPNPWNVLRRVREAVLVAALAVFLVFLAHSSATAATQGRPIPGEILVKYKKTASRAQKAAARATVKARLERQFGFINVEHQVVTGMTTERAIELLRKDKNVLYAEPNYEIHADVAPNDPRFPEMYGLRNTGQTGGTPGADIKATQAWDLFTGDPNILIGVIDTGVDYNHPDLAANVWTNPGEIPGNNIDDDGNGYVDDVHGYDFANNDGDPFDDNGHGTHVSGTIAAVGNNNTGVVGVNWRAKIVGIKFLSGGGGGSTAAAIAGIQYAIAVGVRLTSNSWGGAGFSQALLDAINEAGVAGQLFIAASGNSSVNTDLSPHYPSAYDSPYIIAVAATDNRDNLASFSNFGATTVDIAAPGVNILSTLPGSAYGALSGTSMAAPHVSGVVALTWGRFPAISNLQVKNLILAAADVKASLAGKCATGGRLNAFMSIAEPDSTPPGSIGDLVTTDPGSNTMGLHWTATGDDGSSGRASRYEIRYSTSPINESNWSAATPAPGPDPRPAGTAESFEVAGLSFSTAYYFAIKAFDEFNNTGPLSNVANGMTLGAPDITASPSSFSAELLTGATETQTLTLRNDGAGTLDFTIPTPNLVFLAPANPYQPYEKNEADTRVGPPVTDSKGGPDALGYRWVDSDEPGGAVFSWADITGLTTPVPISGDDVLSAPIAMGMSFPFYGGTFSTVRICTNGFLSFNDLSTAFDNQMLPNVGAPGNLVAPMWDDLDFRSAQLVYAYNDGARFIVSWVGVPHLATGGPYTFQAILYPSGEIRFQYLLLGSPTNSATAGIQNGTKSVGLTVAFNTPYLKNNLAVRIVPLSQWLTVSPSNGRIPAGQSRNVDVRFNALGLAGGTFEGSVHVTSNDPDEGDVSLPTHLHVIGAPDIAVSPASLDFGSIFAGASPTQTLSVTNPGSENLVVTGITSNDLTVTASPTSFTLTPHAATSVIVNYHPTTPSTANATLSIASNDPDTPVKTVSVTGIAAAAPSFTLAPGSFDVALLSNVPTSRTLTVGNTGGSNYNFTAEPLMLGASGEVHVGSDADNVFVDKGQPDVLSGPTPLRAGGPDVFGYTYQDSDEPGGPTFSWVDIRPVGTQINLDGDDGTTAAIPIGFTFPFYGNTFRGFHVCTNGFVSLSSALTTFNNTSLPNGGGSVPENLLAVFWDDLGFGAVNRAYYYNDGTRLIVQYQDVPRLNESAPNSFEIILYRTGTIVYQYLEMSTDTKTSCTIGMQNQTKNDGLQVVFNQNYMKNNLAIRFQPPFHFLTVTPASGTVPPGGSANLTVGFNASGLVGGLYQGVIRIRGNDPVLPQRDVDCRLTVTGVPDIAALPPSITFGNVFVGFPTIRQLTVENRGTDVLHISGVTTSDPAYGVDQTSFSVPSLGSGVLLVSFNPPAPSPIPGTLTITSDDPDTPNLVVNLTGDGLLPPDIAVAPSSFSATLPIPTSQASTLRIENHGASDLNFVIGALLTAASVPIYDELKLAKGQPDPRTGILGTGGPDVFGYTWRDSDDPEGPVFDWVDITTIGTLLPLTGDDSMQNGVPIGFDFPFYGSIFSSVNVCTNGWLSFTNTEPSFINQPLPNSGNGAPENLLAAFWDDLNPETIQRVYTYRDGTRFIVTYQLVPRHSLGGPGGPYTFQVILYPTGRIVYQYLDMQGTRLNEATIGIQNGTRNDGLTVVHNAAYMHNDLAIELRTKHDWLVARPTTGTVPAGGSFDVQVTLDTDQLFGGTYHGELRVTSNDPDEGVVAVPATLTAVGVPDISATPASLDFGTLYLSQTRDLTVLIRNDGSDVLTVASAATSNPSYQLVGATFPITLGHRGSTTLTVRFAPLQACAPPSPCAGNLTLISNDPDEGTLQIPLSGFALIPPEAGLNPTSIRAALATTLGSSAITRTKTLRLGNTGGSDLNWTAEALSTLPAALDVTPSAETGKDQAGSPGIAVLQSGGPDAFGYRYGDSDDPVQGTPFSWIDITAVGTPIALNDDDQNLGPYPLPFEFPFYGATHTQFRVCTNGWISFTSPQAAFTNTGLPNAASGTPENLLAAFWDDLDFRAAGRAYYHYDGAKFIIEYAGVPRLISGGPYTFEIILYPSGTIDFQYLDMQGTRLNEATVGIQNATRDIALQVVFNATYVKNNLRVRFSRQPGWLTVSPGGGTIHAGEHGDLAVTFSATGLPDGDRSGVVRVLSNDLTDPTLSARCDVHVGSVTAELELNPNNLSRSSKGNSVSGDVEPGGYDPRAIRTSSVLLQRAIPVAANSKISYHDKDKDGNEEARYRFSRLDLLRVLPSGNSVPVEVIGEVEDITWFAGSTAVRSLKPLLSATLGPGSINNQNGHTMYYAGSTHPLSWSDPAGFTASYYEFWFSSNGGESWSLAQGNMTSRSLAWQIPAVSTTAAVVELVGVDSQGIMGSWTSPGFDIITSPTGVAEEAAVPKDYALRMKGANPLVSGSGRFELALPKPAAARVRVYDVTGRVVRDLVGRTLTAGYHRLQWDGRNTAGKQVGSGIYFLRAEVDGKRMDLRVAVVR